MPNRIIRENARTSPTLDQLSDGAERSFWRETTVCDDYGRFDADPRVLLAQCYPLRVGRWQPSRLARHLAEWQAVGLVEVYQVGDRTYGRFVTWGKWQRERTSLPKFPGPDDGAATRGELPPVAARARRRARPRSESRESRDESRDANSPPTCPPSAPGHGDGPGSLTRPGPESDWPRLPDGRIDAVALQARGRQRR